VARSGYTDHRSRQHTRGVVAAERGLAMPSIADYDSLKGDDDDGSQPVVGAEANDDCSVEVGAEWKKLRVMTSACIPAVSASDVNKQARTTSFSSSVAAKEFVRRAQEGKERSRLADDEAVHVMNLAAFKHPELVAQYEAELKEFLGQFGTIDAVDVRVRRLQENGVKKVSWALVTFADSSAGAADAAILGAAEAALSNSRLSGMIVTPVSSKLIGDSTGMMRQVSVDHASKLAEVRQMVSRENNDDLGMHLSALFWRQPNITRPTNLADHDEADEAEVHTWTWFTWLIGLIVWLFMPVLMTFHAWTFISGWDPHVLVLAGFPSAIVYGVVFFKLLEVTHPSKGEIAQMARGPRLNARTLVHRRYWRALLIVWSVYTFVLGLFHAFTILTTATEDLGVLNVGYLYTSSGSAWRSQNSQNPHAWGGFAGTTVARVVASTSTVALYSCFAFVLSPFLYSLLLSYYLATGAAGAAIIELKEINLRPDPISVADMKYVGRLVHTVHDAVLEPFTR
jgi:hypothetical protein